MKKDNAALFILFSVLTHVPLANAQLPDCEKITTSAVAGQGRYAVYCGEERFRGEDGRESFTGSQADAILENKRLEAEKYEELKASNSEPHDSESFGD